MLAKYILAALAAVFLATAILRITGGRGWGHQQVRTFLLIGAIFSIVSAWLFYQQ